MNLTSIKNLVPVLRKLSKDYDTILLQNRQFINNTHCTRAAARRCSTKLLVLSKVFWKISQISLENIYAGYDVNVKVWFYAFSLYLYYKRDSCTQLFSSEFRRIFKKTFLLEHSWVSASDFIFDIFKLNKYRKVSFLFTFFTEKLK